MSQTPCPCEAIVTNSSMLDMAGVKLPFRKLSFHVAPGSLPWRTTILMPRNGLFLVINLKTCLVGSRMVASAITGWWPGEARDMRAPRRAPRGPGGEEEAATTRPAVWPAPMLGLQPHRLPPNTAITDLTSARPVSALMLLRVRIKADPGEGGTPFSAQDFPKQTLGTSWSPQSPRRLHLASPVTLLRGKQNKCLFCHRNTIEKQPGE